MKHKRLSNVDSVKQITVIEVKSIKGVGTTEDPISQITEYFLPDGARLARVGLNDNFEEIHEWSTPQTKGEGKMKNTRGYFGIGVYHPKTSENIGTLWRSAHCMGADFIFTIGHRYKKQASDTMATPRHVPLWEFLSFEEFESHMPKEAQLVFVEQAEKAKQLTEFNHPQQAIYMLGAEDMGIPEQFFKGHTVVEIPTSHCLNVAVAGSIVLYDRLNKLK